MKIEDLEKWVDPKVISMMAVGIKVKGKERLPEYWPRIPSYDGPGKVKITGLMVLEFFDRMEPHFWEVLEEFTGKLPDIDEGDYVDPADPIPDVNIPGRPSDLPFKEVIEWSGETEDIGNGAQQRMFYLPGHPRDDYGTMMDLDFGTGYLCRVKETRDMQVFPAGIKYRPEGGGRGADSPGIKIYAAPAYDKQTITIYHN